ncbi:hypothetical protein KUTeg_000878 [Tegillarca granosa]|uniref:C-type lectin domain-containing protein n=1 Tax=Tegillarca granosa TaxID=220873 RepID=A0ABQ9FXM9_TEGGR|nr:hypothetical protein KUTeg_000878 [Tegillarca granosa]
MQVKQYLAVIAISIGAVTCKTIVQRPMCACPAGWKEYNADNKCFYFSRDTLNYPDSMRICGFLSRSHGKEGQLALPDDAAENTFLTNVLENLAYNYTSFFIGFIDQAVEGVFVYPKTNVAIKYSNWGPNQPNNRYDSENCVTITKDLTYGFNNTWADEVCIGVYNYICEMSSA